MPLTMRQISNQNFHGRRSKTTKPSISITSDILDFLGYDGQQDFERLLERADDRFAAQLDEHFIPPTMSITSDVLDYLGYKSYGMKSV